MQNYVVTELAEAGTVYDIINKKGSLPDHLARNVFSQCLNGLQHLHSRGIAHRDIKLENLLVIGEAEAFTVKISDFGTCTHFKSADQMRGLVGTEFHIAPEMWA